LRARRGNRTAHPNQRSAGRSPVERSREEKHSPPFAPDDERAHMATKGILGRKLGMTQVWDDENRVVPVTVIQAGPCRVVQLKTPERDGYSAVQLSFGETKPRRLNKPELGHLKLADAAPTKYLAELRVNDLAGFELGQVLKADVFAAGERVDVTGISKGHGFSGGMKRHNVSRPSDSHRAHAQ